MEEYTITEVEIDKLVRLENEYWQIVAESNGQWNPNMYKP